MEEFVCLFERANHWNFHLDLENIFVYVSHIYKEDYKLYGKEKKRDMYIIVR